MGASTTAFDVREDLSLTMSEFDHAMNEAGYVGHRLFPATPVKSRSGKYTNLPLEEEFSDDLDDLERNEDMTFKVSSMEFASDDYTTKNYGHEAHLDEVVVAQYADFWDAEQSENARLQRKIMRAFEIMVAAQMTAVANYAISRVKGGLTAWSEANIATIKPLTVVEGQRESFANDAGVEPNAIVMTRHDMRLALRTTEVLDRLTGQNFQDAQAGKMMNPQVLANALDIEHVIVANARKNTGKSRNLSRIWPNGRAVLAYVRPEGADSTLPCYGQAMVWSPMGAVNGTRVACYGESYEKPDVAGYRVRQRANWGLKVRNVEMARLLLLDGTAQPE